MIFSGSEEPLGDIVAPSTTLLDEFLSSFSCAAPRSLLEEPIHVQIDGESTCSERRSGRLDKKNRNNNIPTAKRAEYRLAEAYGELPKGMKSKKGSEEDVQEKMNSYLRMYKKPLRRQRPRQFVHWWRPMVDLIFQKVRCEFTSSCRHVLQVAVVVLVGYVVLTMVLGLGTLVSGSDDVP